MEAADDSEIIGAASSFPAAEIAEPALNSLEPCWAAPYVVFLDCDGVLVNSRSVLCDYEDDDPSLFCDPHDNQLPIERSCLEQLKRIVDFVEDVFVCKVSVFYHIS